MFLKPVNPPHLDHWKLLTGKSGVFCRYRPYRGWKKGEETNREGGREEEAESLVTNAEVRQNVSVSDRMSKFGPRNLVS